jgi:glyoxalase family protein
VPGPGAIDFWARRLADRGVTRVDRFERRGRAGLAFEDPEGQRLELVDDGGAPGGRPWEGSPVPPEAAIRGLHGVTLTVKQLEPTAWLLGEVLGFRGVADGVVGGSAERKTPDGPAEGTGPDGPAERTGPDGQGGRTVVFESGPGGPGTEVRVEARPEAPPGVVGPGGVHHVAFRVPDGETQERWRARIAAARVPVTPVVERYYFKSIYFHEPGGVLFEIATDGPGFTADEDAEHLGERLALPPFLEPHRAEIEAGLRPLPTGPAGARDR